jgi:hypothetical protein
MLTFRRMGVFLSFVSGLSSSLSSCTSECQAQWSRNHAQALGKNTPCFVTSHGGTSSFCLNENKRISGCFSQCPFGQGMSVLNSRRRYFRTSCSLSVSCSPAFNMTANLEEPSRNYPGIDFMKSRNSSTLFRWRILNLLPSLGYCFQVLSGHHAPATIQQRLLARSDTMQVLKLDSSMDADSRLIAMFAKASSEPTKATESKEASTGESAHRLRARPHLTAADRRSGATSHRRRRAFGAARQARHSRGRRIRGRPPASLPCRPPHRRRCCCCCRCQAPSPHNFLPFTSLRFPSPSPASPCHSLKLAVGGGGVGG